MTAGPRPVSALLQAKAVDAAGVAVGTLSELMLDPASGRVVYAALAVGGLLGVGERLVAVPWSAFTVAADGAVTVSLSSDALADHPGFDKDHWPSQPDAAIAKLCGTRRGDAASNADTISARLD